MTVRLRRAPRSTVVGWAACSLLLVAYASLAWGAVRRESPTFDEPYHAVSAWVQLHRGDYRIDNEDPPLWQYWASLPNGPRAIRADFDGPLWRDMATQVSNQWTWTTQVLYRTPGNDGAAFVRRCRAMMLVLAVALGVAIAAWAWRLGGPVAATAATALFAFDPNFLAHGPLMKNDVVAALAWLALAWALWDVGRRVTAASVARLIVLAAVPVTVKYSGLLAAGLVPLVLGTRALLGEPWPAGGRSMTTRRARVAAAGAITLGAAGFAFVALWAVYGFRFRSGPAAGDRLDIPQLVDRAVDNERKVHPTQTGPGLPVRAAVFADDHHLLPEPFLAGFLFTYGQSLIRPAYLLGERSLTGWWYYFPVVMLMKTPVATLLAGAGAGVVAVAHLRRSGPAGRWAAIALLIPVAVYMASAMSTHLNIGLRHVLPAYPPAFVAAGWAMAVAVRRWARRAVNVRAMLAAGLLAETAAAWPHFIPFVNAPTLAHFDGNRLAMFGDSNVDWGQDLPLLADWQRAHPSDTLYLSYFGLADPRAYGIRYVPLPGGYPYDGVRRRFPDPARPCWLAVSASNLNWASIADARLQPYYRQLAARSPTAVLGDSIWLFHYDPVEALGASVRGR